MTEISKCPKCGGRRFSDDFVMVGDYRISASSGVYVRKCSRKGCGVKLWLGEIIDDGKRGNVSREVLVVRVRALLAQCKYATDNIRMLVLEAGEMRALAETLKLKLSNNKSFLEEVVEKANAILDETIDSKENS